jgi:hypothetical protein
VGTPRSAGLVARVQNILMKPAAEWEVIAGESTTIRGLFTGYAAVLALLPLVGSVLGGVLGALVFHALGIVVGLVTGLVTAALGYVLSLVGVYVFSLIINALATTFDAKSDAIQAAKVAVYGMTPAWVAGVFSFIPGLGGLIGLVGFGYSCYVIYLGIGKVMQAPADKAVAYAAVSIIAYLVLFAIVFWVIAIIVGIIVAMTVGAAAVTGAAMLGGVH